MQFRFVVFFFSVWFVYELCYVPHKSQPLTCDEWEFFIIIIIIILAYTQMNSVGFKFKLHQ